MGLQKKTVRAMGGLTSSEKTVDSLTLEVIEGPHQGETFPLTQELLRIGREEWCDISLPDDMWVSHIHCECWLEESGLRIQDLKSSNGIKLNDVPVFDAHFVPGARLQVGRTVFALRSEQKPRQVSIQYHDKSGTLVGKSQAMRKIFTILPRLGKRKVTTLLTGETGTGKTSIARAIHLQHNDEKDPFVVVNCGALPSSLINAALFGHERGAFTGADKRHIGFFEQANGGTLFLDEIAELPLELQPKLLDVLERRTIRRLGSEVERPVDFHLITATHRDLQEESAAGRFREDLFFRLSVLELYVPPLRERSEDIPLLVEAFLKELSPDETLYASGALMKKLQSRLWPGNIRELRNALERAMIFQEGSTIDVDALELIHEKPEKATPLKPKAPARQTQTPAEESEWLTNSFPGLPLAAHDPALSLKDILKETERIFIEQALQETDRSVPEAAKLLSLSESWLYSRIKLHGLATRRKR